MARPALVIGLGGTGQWVLTYLKKDLLEIGKGELPPGVRLLCFDTTKHASVVAGHESQVETDPYDQRRKLAGAVELEDKTEFIHFGSNLNELADEISNGKHHHLSWFTATDFISKLPPASLNADDGAGAIRHVGRLCLVKDVQARAMSKIISAIENAIEGIAQDQRIAVENRLEICIIGSLAGGTGAGMLVDIPLLCRELSEAKFPGNIIVRGFIVTPRAFVAGAMGKGQEMLARSFAAWRELDRYLITSSKFGENKVVYSERDTNLTLSSPRRLYDTTYILDPQRLDNPLEPGDSENGLFPSIANALSAILDEKAGLAYSEQIINLSDTYGNLELIPTHSGIGAYTLKVPVYYAQQSFAYDLGSEILNVLLAPEFNEHNRVIRLSDTANSEVPQGLIGRTAVLDFFNTDTFTIDGDPIPNTLLTKLIARIRFHNGQDDDRILKEASRPGLTRRRGEFLTALTDIGQDERGKALSHDITKELETQLWQMVAPSRQFGDTPDDAFARITNGIRKVSQNHYGMDVQGKRLRGSYGDTLEKAKHAQLHRFGLILRAWMDYTLNGDSVNPRMARGGKLGYIQSFFENMIEVLDYFVGFINTIDKKRSEELNLEEKARRRALSARDVYNNERTSKCWLTFWDDFVHPRAHQAQRNYVQAEQRVVDIRKDGILLNVLAESVLEIKAIAQNTLEDINRWVVHLGTGDVQLVDGGEGKTDQIEIVSLYHAMKQERENIEVNHNLDKKLSAVSEVIGEHSYGSSASFIDDALDHLKWDVVQDQQIITEADGTEYSKTKSLKAVLTVIPLDDNGDNQEFRNSGFTAIKDNLQIFSRLAAQPFASLELDHPFAEDIRRITDTNTGTKLADHIHKKGEPLYRKTATGIGPLHQPYPRSALCRVDSSINPEAEDYFQEFHTRLEELDPTVRSLLVESDDLYKMTIVRFDDVIKSEDFEIWEKCREAYIKTALKRDIAELHVFQAEINACKYEELISNQLHKDYRILHPDIVALLSDDQRIEMFFRGLALGLICRVEGDNGESYWEYQIDKSNPVRLSDAFAEFGHTDEKYFLNLINQFVVKGEDYREGYSGSNWIDFDELAKVIRARHRELGTLKGKKLYKEQLSDSNGMLQQMRDYIKKKRADVKDRVARAAIAKEIEDMADLTEAIYLVAAESGK